MYKWQYFNFSFTFIAEKKWYKNRWCQSKWHQSNSVWSFEYIHFSIWRRFKMNSKIVSNRTKRANWIYKYQFNIADFQALFFFAVIVCALAEDIIPTPERYPPGVDPLLCPGKYIIMLPFRNTLNYSNWNWHILFKINLFHRLSKLWQWIVTHNSSSCCANCLLLPQSWVSYFVKNSIFTLFLFSFRLS